MLVPRRGSLPNAIFVDVLQLVLRVLYIRVLGCIVKVRGLKQMGIETY